jgi:hypothetical protein
LLVTARSQRDLAVAVEGATRRALATGCECLTMHISSFCPIGLESLAALRRAERELAGAGARLRIRYLNRIHLQADALQRDARMRQGFAWEEAETHGAGTH